MRVGNAQNDAADCICLCRFPPADFVPPPFPAPSSVSSPQRACTNRWQYLRNFESLLMMKSGRSKYGWFSRISSSIRFLQFFQFFFLNYAITCLVISAICCLCCSALISNCPCFRSRRVLPAANVLVAIVAAAVPPPKNAVCCACWWPPPVGCCSRLMSPFSAVKICSK